MKLRLYVVNAAKYQDVIDLVKQILSRELGAKHDLEIINVPEHPVMAEQDNIILTPTLINTSIDPPKRVVGSMADKEKILIALSISNE